MRNTVFALALTVVAAVAVGGAYSGTVYVPFQYDDIHSIVDNPHIRSLENVPSFFVDPTLFSHDSKSAMYRPVVLTTYAVNHWLSGYEPWGYHLTNVMIHIANGVLVFLLVLQLTQMRVLSFAAAIIFALHPVNSESVIYVSSRSESLCALFVLISLWSHLRAREQEGRTKLGWYVLSLITLSAALGAKSVAVTFPTMLLLVELSRAASNKRTESLLAVRLHLPYWLLVVAYVVATRRLIESAVIDGIRLPSVQFWTQVKACLYYVKLLIMPTHLSVEHQFELGHSLSEPAVAAALAAVVSALWVLWIGRRHAGGGLYWMAAFTVTAVPALVVPLNVLVNEHRLYTLSIATTVIGAAALLDLSRRHSSWVSLVHVLYFGTFCLLCFQRTDVWNTPGSLWRDALAKGPFMPRTHLYVGDALMAAGEQKKALEEYDLALSVYPEVLSGGDMLSVYNNKGSASLALGRAADAIAWYTRALEVDSTYTQAREAVRGLRAFHSDREEEESVALKKVGLLAMVKGQLAESIGYFKRSLDLGFAPDTYLSLGIAYERIGDLESAMRVYVTLPLVAPDSPYIKAAAANAEKLAASGVGN